MLLLICGLLIIVILEGFSSHGKLQCFSQFYIVDFVISMLFYMSMNAILHKVLLIILMDKITIMGTDYTRLSLKTQSLLRSAIANLPTNIQFHILRSKAMSRSFDLWFEYFKILVTTTIPDPANSDDISDILEQADLEDHFGSSLKVYERKHLFLVLLVNYDDGSDVANSYDNVLDLDDVDRGPNWLSQMFEYGFIRLIKLTSPDQAS